MKLPFTWQTVKKYTTYVWQSWYKILDNLELLEDIAQKIRLKYRLWEKKTYLALHLFTKKHNLRMYRNIIENWRYMQWQSLLYHTQIMGRFLKSKFHLDLKVCCGFFPFDVLFFAFTFCGWIVGHQIFTDGAIQQRVDFYL